MFAGRTLTLLVLSCRGSCTISKGTIGLVYNRNVLRIDLINSGRMINEPDYDKVNKIICAPNEE